MTQRQEKVEDVFRRKRMSDEGLDGVCCAPKGWVKIDLLFVGMHCIVGCGYVRDMFLRRKMCGKK